MKFRSIILQLSTLHLPAFLSRINKHIKIILLKCLELLKKQHLCAMGNITYSLNTGV